MNDTQRQLVESMNAELRSRLVKLRVALREIRQLAIAPISLQDDETLVLIENIADKALEEER